MNFVKRFSLDVRKIVDNLIKQTNNDVLKWTTMSRYSDYYSMCGWRIVFPLNSSPQYTASVELKIFPIFHSLKLTIGNETFSRNQKLLSGLRKAIKAQERRLYSVAASSIERAEIQRILATAKKFENPED